jgi:hypothetical protein
MSRRSTGIFVVAEIAVQRHENIPFATAIAELKLVGASPVALFGSA